MLPNGFALVQSFLHPGNFLYNSNKFEDSALKGHVWGFDTGGRFPAGAQGERNSTFFFYFLCSAIKIGESISLVIILDFRMFRDDADNKKACEENMRLCSWHSSWVTKGRDDTGPYSSIRRKGSKMKKKILKMSTDPCILVRVLQMTT